MMRVTSCELQSLASRGFCILPLGTFLPPCKEAQVQISDHKERETQLSSTVSLQTSYRAHDILYLADPLVSDSCLRKPQSTQ